MATSHSTREASKTVSGGADALTWMCVAVAEHALHRVGLRPGARLLDVAAGNGSLGLTAARLGARVLATDVSPPVVKRLNRRAHEDGLSSLEGRVMDGHTLELEDGSFDVSGSQSGITLTPNVQVNLGELARVTRPGGHVLIIGYGPSVEVEFLNLYLAAVQAVLPDITGLRLDPPPLPFQMAVPNGLRRELADAGLNDIRVERVTHGMRFRSGTQLWSVVTCSPVGAGLAAELADEPRAEIQQVLDGMLRERSGGGTAVLNSTINIGIGTK